MFKNINKIYEDIKTSQSPLVYDIQKYSFTENKGTYNSLKIVYKFKTKLGKWIGIIFKTDATNRVVVDSGLIDKNFNIVSKVILEKPEFVMFLNTRKTIFNRFLDEYPNYYKIII